MALFHLKSNSVIIWNFIFSLIVCLFLDVVKVYIILLIIQLEIWINNIFKIKD